MATCFDVSHCLITSNGPGGINEMNREIPGICGEVLWAMREIDALAAMRGHQTKIIARRLLRRDADRRRTSLYLGRAPTHFLRSAVRNIRHRVDAIDSRVRKDDASIHLCGRTVP